MNPLTRNEVESWPALGPMNLDKQRVLDLITAVECLQASHLFLPLSLREALSRGDVDACRDYARHTEDFMASLQQDAANARAENAKLLASVTTAEIRAEVAEKAAADWKYLATLRRGFLADVEKKCDELTARLATSPPERVCRCTCLTAADVGVSLPGNPVAYAHPECQMHNSESHFTSDSEGGS